MFPARIPLGSLSPEGLEVTLDDPALWRDPLAEFGMDCRMEEPLSATLRILPVDGGWLIRGVLRGTVIVPCCRCAEDARVVLREEFEDFEEDPDAEDAAGDGESRIVEDDGLRCLDAAAMAWEEFVLALPPAPLCAPECRGLCPRCGANLNRDSCSCAADEGDPRMAALRGLKVARR